ncbi:uncharacterized protein LOC112517013 isoform X2 [Cynara cardunculus var. scolymus]|uniref:uncharacterized protein LOC112517013 isoform X2 n=1 Tax=Cynara cardunculus var. scolymus TaxID=59895 RepID=UPI000D629687|nr:uncharacterized protein LOC112517013 isoform X2 [Cynara cardunculus var. scolymus]
MELNQQHNHMPSSMYTYFSDQAVKGMNRVDSREEIQIELEKERIREQIVAKEIVRLGEKVRREMMMDNGWGFPSRGPPVSFEENYGRHNQEIAVQRLPWLPQMNLTDMGRLNGSANWNENGSWVHGESQRFSQWG